MTLIEVGTHAIIDAVFGADSEQVQARALLGALQPGMLLLEGPQIFRTENPLRFFPGREVGLGLD